MFFTSAVHGFSKALYYVEEGRELEAVFQLFVKGETKTNPGLVIQGNISAVVNYAAGEVLLPDFSKA